jgi:hypothetical protein
MTGRNPEKPFYCNRLHFKRQPTTGQQWDSPPHYTTQLLRARESDGLRDSILQMESPGGPPSSRRSRAHAILSPRAQQVPAGDAVLVAVLVDHRLGQWAHGEPEPSGQSVLQQRPARLQLSPSAALLPICHTGGRLVGAGRGQAPEAQGPLCPLPGPDQLADRAQGREHSDGPGPATRPSGSP